MVERIIETCLRNRFLVVAFYVLIAGWAVWAFVRLPIDALPDLSENQVIVFTEWLGRSPQEVEDQITYPLVVNLQGLAGVKVIRSSSSFSFSTVYVIFEDSVDLYWARTRVLERLALVAGFLPAGVTPTLGPDATALGHVMWYTLEGKGYDLGTLRAIQDWFVRYQLTAVPGVAEVGSVGGFVRQYQIDVDP
ncbi:MAG: efflux RND transporter permease subunit, partial [Actinomycetota bacterium]